MILGKPLSSRVREEHNDHMEREAYSQTPEGMWPQWFLGKPYKARCAVPLLSPVARQIADQEAPLLRSTKTL